MKYDIQSLIKKNPELNVLRVLQYQHIRPIISGFYIKTPHLFNIAFAWSPFPIFPALFLEKVTTITAKSYYGYYGLFKPSIAEIIDCIPDSYINDVSAFEITGSVEIKDPYHEFEVTLYRRKKFNLRILASKFSLKGIE